jgi:transcription initiation factor TFIID subunit TAF12
MTQKRKPKPQPEVVTPEEPKKRWIVKETPIDKFTILRKRVLLTGCVCEDCGFNFCERNGFPEWETLDIGQRTVVEQALKEHKKLHTVAENKIITEGDDVQNNLGKPAPLS